MSSNTTSAPKQCSHAGKPDFYGLGIRVGMYLQLITAVLANYLHINAVSDNLSTNAIFLMALFIAMVTATTRADLRAEEVVILLQLCFGFLLSVLALLGSRTSLSRFEVSHRRSKLPAAASFFRLTLTTVSCAYAVWFWFLGDAKLNPPGCPAYIFLFTRTSIQGGAGTFYKVQSILILIPLVMLLIWQLVGMLWYFIAIVVRDLANPHESVFNEAKMEDWWETERGMSGILKYVSEFVGALRASLIRSRHVPDLERIYSSVRKSTSRGSFSRVHARSHDRSNETIVAYGRDSPRRCYNWQHLSR